MSSLLEVKDLSVEFRLKSGLLGKPVILKAVNQVSLKISRGETFGLVGESGCGKTTLARAIVGLNKHSAGKILFQGLDLLDGSVDAARRREIQMIFQDPGGSLNPRMTVEAIVAEPFKIQGDKISNAGLRQKVVELLESVGLSKTHLERYPHEFSGGQKQRIAVARALALKPQLIICDEPVSALDVSVQGQVINLLQDLQEKFAISFLFVAHDLAVVEQISHQIGVMYLGRIVEQGNPTALSSSAAHPYTQALIASVPSIEKRNRSLQAVAKKGVEMPSPLNPPSGCPYHPRCPYAQDRCRTELPALREIAPNQSAACHYAEQIKATNNKN